MEQNIIKGTIAQAERMRNRNESRKAIESLEDLDPNCASLTLDLIQKLSTLTLEPKDVEMILRGPSKRNWTLSKPLFNETNGDITYERLPDRDDEFSTDVVRLWMQEARKAFDIAFPENGTVWCNCTLAMMGGWTEADIMSPSRFLENKGHCRRACPEKLQTTSPLNPKYLIFKPAFNTFYLKRCPIYNLETWAGGR